MLGATLQIARGHGEDRFYSPAMARRSYLHHHHNLQRYRSYGSAGVSSIPVLVSKGNTAFPEVHVPEDRIGSGEEPSGPAAVSTASSSSTTSSSSCSSLESEKGPSENAPSCNLGRFVESTTPSVPDQNHSKSTVREWRMCDADYRPYFALGDLWDSFKEWSAYGAAVPLVLDGGDRVVQYYVPYLSGIQLYGRSTDQAASSRRLGEESDDDCYRNFSSYGSSDYDSEKQLKLKTCAKNTSVININKVPLRENDVAMTDEFSSEDSEVGSSEGTLLFEYLEHDPPYSREPLANKVSALACLFPGLKTLRSCDLSPSSWISVAWYPIYRIPTGSTLRDLDACFLTFHSLWTPMKGKIMIGGIFGRAKKAFSHRRNDCRNESSGSSSHPSTSEPEIPLEEMPEEQMEEEPPQPVQQHPTDDGIILIDSQGCFVRRRGRATCETVKNLPHGTRINIEVNDSGIPCNFPESTLLASYLGMLVKDPVLAPISFEDWRKPGMKRYKMLLCADVESKFAYNSQVRQWVLKSLGVKWRNFKTALKAAYWDGRSIKEVIEGVPEGIDALQWATLVSTWDDPRNKARAEQNTQNAQKQKCPHTMGRKSTVQRQQDTSTKDRLQLWRLNRLHKDGSWTSEDAKEKWELACQRLAESNLTPDDGNVEENEKVFLEVMGPEHSGRVRCGGFGVTPSNYYPQTSSSTGCSSTGASSYARSDERLTRVETDVVGLKGTVNQIQGTVDEMYAFIREQANKEKDL